MDPLLLMRKALEDAEEWDKRKTGTEDGDSPATTTTRMGGWKKPPGGWLKCNSDGAWSPQRDTAGLGWVLRNDLGRALWIGTRAIPNTTNAFDVEAEALRWALVSLQRLGYVKVMFESDSKSLVEAITDPGNDKYYKPLIQDIRMLLSRFEGDQISFSNRETNRAADRAAKEALGADHLNPTMFSVVPLWLKQTVALDACSISLN